MSRHFKTLASVLLLGVLAFVVYGRRLQDAPMYLSPDEVLISVDAQSIASTAHDVEGRFLPLYFNIGIPGETRSGWFTPMIFYFSALFLKLLPPAESTVRLPTVFVGVTDIVLMFFLAKKLFNSGVLATFACALLAMTPAHFMLSRLGLDYIYPLPFILAWLLCLVSFVEREKPALLFAATTFLGLGFYSYIASVLLAPLYLLLTFLILLQTNKPAKLYVIAAVGFVLPLLLLVPWAIRHPTAFSDTVQRYDLYDAKHLNALQGMRSFVSYTNIDQLVSLYWSFFNPSFLFLSGAQQMMFSTRSVGVFLLPVAVFLPLGMYHAGIRRRTPISLLILLGFVTGPLAAVLVAEQGTIHRAVAMLPFGVLLATFGAEYLWSAHVFSRPRRVLLPVGVVIFAAAIIYGLSTMVTQFRVSGSTAALIVVSVLMILGGLASERVRLEKMATLGLIALIGFQFARFHADYFGDYRIRAAPWFGGNVRGALEGLIELDGRKHPPLIYFSIIRSTSGRMDTANRWMPAYWKFYVIKHGRRDLLGRTAQFDPQSLQAVPPGSLVLANLGDVTTDALVKSGALKVVALTTEVDRDPVFAILQR